MPKRRNNHAGIDDITWRYLNDASTPEDRNTWDWDFLEHMPDRVNGSWGYTCRQAWEAHQDVILANWMRRHPGTRPRSWYRLSGAQEQLFEWYREHKLHPDHPRNAYLRLSDILDLIDQRAWLAEHGHLANDE